MLSEGNPHAIITGGSSGIGLAFAHAFVAKGISVTIIARDRDKLTKAVASITLVAVSGARVQSFQADVSDPDALQVCLKLAVEKFGLPEWAIACAGIVTPGLFSKQSNAESETQINVNYLGTVYFTRAVLPFIKQSRKRHLILVSSGASLVGFYGYSAYGASKFAVRGFAESLRVELMREGIIVTLLCPGDTATPQLTLELETRPKVSQYIMAGAPILQPDKVVSRTLKCAAQGKFLVTFGWRLRLLNRIHSLFAPIFQSYQIRIARKFEDGAN